jgi:hypothetical protein
MIHNIYARLPESIRGEVDAAYKRARAVLAAAGLQPANDDRAETLVEAIAVYVLESRPEIENELSERN